MLPLRSIRRRAGEFYRDIADEREPIMEITELIIALLLFAVPVWGAPLHKRTPTPTPLPTATATTFPTNTPVATATPSTTQTKIDILLGALAPIGVPGLPSQSTYDSTEQSKGTEYAASFPVDSNDMVTSNYYDLAMTLYATFYRTNNTAFRDSARSVAQQWAASINNSPITYAHCFGQQGPDYCSNVPPPRGRSSIGLAVAALEANNSVAQTALLNQAKAVEFTGNLVWSDAREQGYSLMVLTAAILLGHGNDASLNPNMFGQDIGCATHAACASQLLNTILAHQSPVGYWEGTSTLCPSGPFVLNFMNGLLAEALVMYDRAVGDLRIVPALMRWTNWEWTTQWTGTGFHYGTVNDGDCNTNVVSDLNGLMLPAWGYLYAKTGSPMYNDQAKAIFANMMSVIPGVITSEKHYAQLYRSSPKYLGALVP